MSLFVLTCASEGAANARNSKSESKGHDLITTETREEEGADHLQEPTGQFAHSIIPFVVAEGSLGVHELKPRKKTTPKICRKNMSSICFLVVHGLRWETWTYWLTLLEPSKETTLEREFGECKQQQETWEKVQSGFLDSGWSGSHFNAQVGLGVLCVCVCQLNPVMCLNGIHRWQGRPEVTQCMFDNRKTFIWPLGGAGFTNGLKSCCGR